jgi:hypothetical protein
MAPDTTLQRYEIDSFKNTNCKRVPFEELDFTIYKPNANHVAFSTTEIRLLSWIKALYLRYYKHDGFNNNADISTQWAEEENANNPSKCDKITITILVNDNDNALTITVNISTGRIEAIGRYIKEWGAKEFEHLLGMVNKPDETWDAESIKPFMKTITNKEKTSQQPSSPTEKAPAKTSEENMTPTTPREKTFSLMKSQLSNLEAEFIFYKENNQNAISELSVSIEKKDEEINYLKDEIMALKSAGKEKQQIISDLTVNQLQMKQDINAMNKRYKKIEEKNTNLLKMMNTKQKESQPEIPTWASMSSNNSTNTYSVPTSNSFEPLSTKDHTETTPTQTDITKENPQTNKENPQTNISSSQTSKDNPQPKKDSPQPAINSLQPKNDNLQPQNNTIQSNKDDQQPDNHDTTITHKSNYTETIILCDSNGHYLKPKLLCPNSTTSYIRCPTVAKAKHIIQNTNFTNPKKFIIHCGTNDIEHLPPDQNLATEIEDITKLIRGKHPECRIIISSLLPRKD